MWFASQKSKRVKEESNLLGKLSFCTHRPDLLSLLDVLLHGPGLVILLKKSFKLTVTHKLCV